MASQFIWTEGPSFVECSFCKLFLSACFPVPSSFVSFRGKARGFQGLLYTGLLAVRSYCRVLCPETRDLGPLVPSASTESLNHVVQHHLYEWVLAWQDSRPFRIWKLGALSRNWPRSRGEPWICLPCEFSWKSSENLRRSRKPACGPFWNQYLWLSPGSRTPRGCMWWAASRGRTICSSAQPRFEDCRGRSPGRLRSSPSWRDTCEPQTLASRYPQ